MAFLAYGLQVTLKAQLRAPAGGTTPHEALAEFKALQMVDVHLPTNDGRGLEEDGLEGPRSAHAGGDGPHPSA